MRPKSPRGRKSNIHKAEAGAGGRDDDIHDVQTERLVAQGAGFLSRKTESSSMPL